MKEYENLKFQKVIQSTDNQDRKKGDNQDIAISLYEFGLLSKYDIQSRIEDNADVDKLYWMNKTEFLSRSITYDSLIEVWNRVGLLSPAISAQIDKYKMNKWKGSREQFFTMMTILMLKEMLDDQKNRETIIANMGLEQYQFKPGSDAIKTNFLNGNGDISALFLEVEGMHPLPSFYKTKDKRKIEEEVRSLFAMVFPELASELKVWISLDSSSRRLNVSTNKYQYQAEIYRVYEWDEAGEIKALKKPKEFSFNAALLKDIEKILKQLGTDYKSGRIFGFRSFADNLLNMTTEDYLLITTDHPELSVFKNLWYAGGLDLNKADWSADITIAYKNSEMAYYQSAFNSLYQCSSFIEYLPSDKKINVIEFVQKHQQDLDLSDDEIMSVEADLQYELIELSDEIARFIPGIKYTISRNPGVFLSSIPSNTSFSDFFPGLYSFIRQDFNPTLMGLSDDTSELYWKDAEGKMDTIPMNFHSTEESILAYLHIKLKPTGYGIYTIPSLRFTEKRYYYLTQQQKKEMETILNERLVGIK